MNRLLKKIFIVAVCGFLVSIGLSSSASVKIENKINSSSNTGGNSGENVSSGDAVSESRVEVNAQSGENGGIDVKGSVKAQANEIEVEKEFSIQAGEDDVSENVSVGIEVHGGETLEAENRNENGLLEKIFLFIKKLF